MVAKHRKLKDSHIETGKNMEGSNNAQLVSEKQKGCMDRS